jgi:hypothetical protein
MYSHLSVFLCLWDCVDVVPISENMSIVSDEVKK